MRIYKAIDQTDQSEDVARKHSTKEPMIYTCSSCKYESNRQYNVLRHEERIHWNQKLRVCCGKTFLNKGDYYVHCEQLHPETRSHAITSRNKYKITSDTIAVPDESVNRLRHSKRESSCCLQVKENLHLKQRFSERIRIREQREVKSRVSFKYSVTCSDFDMGDVPLINFLTDRRLKTYLKGLSSARLVNTTSDEQEGKANETVKTAISSKKDIEKSASDNDVENVRGKVSNSSVSSFAMELPAKKLLLHRFRTSVMHEIKIPLREENNNICGQVNFAQQQTKETIVPVLQNRSKYPKRSTRANKENVSKFAFSLEQQLDIKLDRGITMPTVSQLHRDFLASIDFDQYKIF